MAYDLAQFKDFIERITKSLKYCSEKSTAMLLGTAAAESDFGTYLNQRFGGPALGPFQMEPSTECWVWERTEQINKERPLSRKFTRIEDMVAISGVDTWLNNGALEYNLAYSVCMARLYYLLIPDPFPETWDILGQAEYWNKHWNRNPLEGSVADYLSKHRRFILNG